MVKEELNQKSPLRKLEAVTEGGVGKGNIGVIASKKGLGKTACLVHLSVDRLLQGKHAIHLSFNSKTDYISTWYEDIFSEISRKVNLECADEAHDDMVKNRIIMNFNSKYPVNKIIESLNSMVENGQDGTDLLIVDGYNFDKGKPDDLKLFKSFAQDKKIEVWFSNSIESENTKNLAPYDEDIEMILTLSSGKDNLSLKVTKNNSGEEGLDLCLDPKTLLIC